MNTPNQNDILGTRQKFEANLRHQRGLQYVIQHDPLEEKVLVDGPNGREQSNVWVIRKQHRENESDSGVTVLGYYYIVNDVIYQAPSVASIFNYRMLNTVSTLNKLFSGPAELSSFTSSHGHTYFKPVQKSTAQALGGGTQQSAEDVSANGTQSSTTDKPDKPDKPATLSQSEDNVDNSSQTLRNALRMTLQYGKEYMDEIPLVGEPGNFRFNKVRDASASQGKGSGTGTGQGTGTPVQSRAASVIPNAASNNTATPTVPSAGEKNNSGTTGAMSKKRRKSKAENGSP